MATVENVNAYISRMCTEMGTSAEKIFNPKTNAWYFSRGSSTIEVFLTSYETANKSLRTFIRCFAPLLVIPGNEKKKLDLYQGALEANAKYMGLKISSIVDKGILCAISERDINGMDYDEMVTLITDIGYWADELDDFLKKTFG
jgi:hypothetical protein